MAEQLDDANAWLMGESGPKSAPFPVVGSIVEGVLIKEPERKQQTDKKTGEKLFWGDGNPRWMLVATIQTDERDPNDPDDDGVRRLFVRGQYMPKAVREAIAANPGCKGMHTGGRIKVQRLADNGDSHTYAAWYTPPGLDAQFAGMVGQQTAPAAAPVVSQPAMVATPAPAANSILANLQQAAAAQQAQPDPAPPAPTGYPGGQAAWEQQWAGLDAAGRTQVRAALGLQSAAAGF